MLQYTKQYATENLKFCINLGQSLLFSRRTAYLAQGIPITLGWQNVTGHFKEY